MYPSLAEGLDEVVADDASCALSGLEELVDGGGGVSGGLSCTSKHFINI